MHLLAAQPGTIDDGADAVDLGQDAGDIVYLCAADTELTLLADARDRLGDEFPTVRLANLMHLGHNMSVDLYVEAVVRKARAVVVRILGGRGYWPYGIDEIAAACAAANIPVAFLPGDDQPDPELADLSTVSTESYHRLWQYGVHGGIDNARELLSFAAHLAGFDRTWQEPRPLVRAGLYWPGAATADMVLLKSRWKANRPVAAVVFYRALVQAGNTAVVDALIESLDRAGLNALPMFVAGLKDPIAAAVVSQALEESPPDAILNATGFALSAPGKARTETPFDAADCPVFQVVFSGGNEKSWREGTRGLSAKDIAMNVALPEVDGRIVTRAVSFKGLARRHAATQTDVVRYEPVADRIDFVAELAAAWAALRRKAPEERRVAMVLANYPNKDGRIGNGVGLDTPAGMLVALAAMKDAGYRIGELSEDGNAIVERLLAGPTNQDPLRGDDDETLSMSDYQIFFGQLSESVRTQVLDRWGPPEADPFYKAGEIDCGRFRISAFRLGNVAVGLQPARGYNIDPAASYHDPALVPPHGYLAFYAWARREFRADAVVHFGKHGNMEWLPGKALALSRNCFPEVALGPVPHLYPFIVNDPGEGTQAKRRAGAVVIDHLTPPLTRAESYGALRDLECLIDEYFEAAGVDPRRLKVLGEEILSLCRSSGLDADCGIGRGDDETQALAKLDGYLCELKEMQIRDGLHVFGVSPTGAQKNDLLRALVRIPRGPAESDASILRALAGDLGLGFDPLDCDLAAPWTGTRPRALETPGAPWRTVGDTVERLETLALSLIAGERAPEATWCKTAAVLAEIDSRIRPALERCGAAEIDGLLKGLAGRFVPPGPSGAPTRGRPDTLPTGRNFYSVDTRTVPTPAAWTLGWKSASLLIERHRQDKGEWPRAVALSAWGTANMRTGGDDIAQGLALMGVRPTWEQASRRVTGFEVMPLSVLGRPRVDVTLRVSGFFRDAFPGLIDLFDSAARAVARLDEPDAENPLAARFKQDKAELVRAGRAPQEADTIAGYRVFGSKPGAYGAGLQALIDERGWSSDADLAKAYIAWGGYAYGAGAEGAAQHGTFEKRLQSVETVIHNQDNREHDLLDSDDYYQFEGGLVAAVRHLSGTQPTAYHADHSRPETPAIRTLEEEIARVVRARVVNSKWIEGAMRHGYKGAFEIAATVDYLFAFAATAKCVKDHHFDLAFEAYLGDAKVREFLEANNPAALAEISARLIEAQDRGLWRPRLNSTRPQLEKLATAA